MTDQREQTPFPGYTGQRVRQPGKGKTLKRRGETPRNIVDPEMVIENLAHLLRVWELNRQYRLKARGLGPRREDRLRGLFGGG
jgi:hypothetical protein